MWCSFQSRARDSICSIRCLALIWFAAHSHCSPAVYKANTPMKVAIVHDFLMQMGGAEKVVEVLHSMFPEAPVYTSAYAADVMPAHFRGWDIRTSFLQRLPYKRITHRLALLLYPLAFESFELS